MSGIIHCEYRGKSFDIGYFNNNSSIYCIKIKKAILSMDNVLNKQNYSSSSYYDVKLINKQNGTEYLDDFDLIPSNTILTIRRKPTIKTRINYYKRQIDITNDIILPNKPKQNEQKNRVNHSFINNNNNKNKKETKIYPRSETSNNNSNDNNNYEMPIKSSKTKPEISYPRTQNSNNNNNNYKQSITSTINKTKPILTKEEIISIAADRIKRDHNNLNTDLLPSTVFEEIEYKTMSTNPERIRINRDMTQSPQSPQSPQTPQSPPEINDDINNNNNNEEHEYQSVEWIEEQQMKIIGMIQKKNRGSTRIILRR